MTPKTAPRGRPSPPWLNRLIQRCEAAAVDRAFLRVLLELRDDLTKRPEPTE